MKFLSHSLTIIFLFSLFGCSKKKEAKNQQNITEQKLPLNDLRSMQTKRNKDLDPCNCNKKSQSIMDKTISVRKKFASIPELKLDTKSKQEIKRLATDYNKLVAKCFEANAAKLFEESECNDLKALEKKKELLYSLGIQIDLGANIRL